MTLNAESKISKTTYQKFAVWRKSASGHLKFWFDKIVQEPDIIQHTLTISTDDKPAQ